MFFCSDHLRRQVLSVLLPGVGDAGDAGRVASDALPLRPTDLDGAQVLRALLADVLRCPEGEDAPAVEGRVHGLVGDLWKQVSFTNEWLLCPLT